MLLKKLTEASGVSGNEKEVREIIISEIKDYVDSITIDKLGNIIAVKKGIINKPKLMITAHMDEVGLMVTGIEESGLIKFTTVGRVDKRILISKPVLVGEKKIHGIIGCKPIHLQEKDERTKTLSIKQLYIDIGATNKSEVEKLINIGEYITFDSKYVEFGDNKVKAKALDDRVGCSILINLLKSKTNLTIYGVFTVMQEVGLIGAGPAAFRVEPNIAIVLEGTLCSDVPDIDSHMIATELGKGPAISLMDTTTYFDIELRNLIINTAKENGIPWQYRRTTSGSSDSGKIHITKEGCKTSTISVPCRYIHSPICVIDKKDFENTSNLLGVIVKELEKGGLCDGV